ncbi:melanoma antigen preferentially expressed in tumors-like [Octodon degus]|uniref:Melanoma antigen preferentially expressed in tumors-like n=1 Tax=Octodon degus TaxID=10160 RepID=A0A6P3V981_OCTDE|nr:melanoma antigen preferentially expressed in tumors-like [Octodon degus]
MSIQSPLSLYKLAKQSLLKHKITASTALHDLPNMIFYDLFKDAFMGGHNEVLKVMVQAWPFPYLPLRTLMDLRIANIRHTEFGEIMPQKRNLQTLQAILDGLDIQLSQKVQHSRWKLQELDWRDVHQDFWTIGPRAMSVAHSRDVLLDKLANTLETLVLEHCDIIDSQILALLPALGCCSQLKTFSCYGNPLSLGILQVLLHQTAGLSQLTEGLYPAPLESYNSNIPTQFVHHEKFTQPGTPKELESHKGVSRSK